MTRLLAAHTATSRSAEATRAPCWRPVDQTPFFAGSYASIDGQGGTVNGALETGERAARGSGAHGRDGRWLKARPPRSRWANFYVMIGGSSRLTD